jgi:hypothetical protein
MLKLKIALFCLALVSFAESGLAATAYYSHEDISGLNKICYYTSSSGMVALTIRAHKVCPVSIKV